MGGRNIAVNPLRVNKCTYWATISANMLTQVGAPYLPYRGSRTYRLNSCVKNTRSRIILGWRYTDFYLILSSTQVELDPPGGLLTVGCGLIYFDRSAARIARTKVNTRPPRRSKYFLADHKPRSARSLAYSSLIGEGLAFPHYLLI